MNDYSRRVATQTIIYNTENGTAFLDTYKEVGGVYIFYKGTD
jgi:hypothetical protein